MTLQNHEGLLPCPFCGGKPFSEECHHQDHSGWHAGCIGCDASPIFYEQCYAKPEDVRTEVERQWNTRYTPPATPQSLRPHEHECFDECLRAKKIYSGDKGTLKIPADSINEGSI